MDKEKLIEKFQSEKFHLMFQDNYRSIMERFHTDGFFPESLNGVYPGMFPRTIGALTRLLICTGELELLEKSIGCCIAAMKKAGMEYVPHVIGKAKNGSFYIHDDICQIDGQAHLILAWALLALERNNTRFEDDTYEFIVRLMNRTVSAGFLGSCTKWRCEPGVILNTHLEHSREWNMWIAYDFLSNSFVAAALSNMIEVAQRRGDDATANQWSQTLKFLEANIHEVMTFEHNGKRCFCEMLLPTGRAPEVFPGLSWLNLAPIPSGWNNYDPQILANTIDLWHERAQIDWDGPPITACEVNFNMESACKWNGPPEMGCEWSTRGHNNQTYGKMLGWDLLYCVKTEDYRRAYDMLDFLEQVNTGKLYSEIFTYKPSLKKWMLRDAGNGEQTAWLCWSLVESRIILGLTPY